MHSHSSCLIFQNLSFMWAIILIEQNQNASVSLQNTWAAAPHLQQAMEGFQGIPEKNVNSSVKAVFLYITGTKFGKTTCAISFPPWEAAPGDNKIPKYRVELCLTAPKLFMRAGTHATLLVPQTLIWVLGNSRTQLGCLNSALTKIKTWLTWQN